MTHYQAIVAITLLASACKQSEQTSPASAAAAVTSQRPSEPSRRRALAVHRPLLDEASRGELDAGGLAIDFGTPDQHKYTRGGWRTGWGDSGADEHTTWATLTSRRGFLEIGAPETPPTAVVFRARSRAADQRLTWFANDRELGTARLGREWSVIRIPITGDAFPREGLVRLEARAAVSGIEGVRADLDWAWLATRDGEPLLGPRVLPLEIAGTTRRVLAAPTARSYGFYLQPVDTAELVVDLGAARRAEFVISAITDGGERIELARETVERAWREHTVSLDQLAGRAVRLELTTTNQSGAAGWGEPELMVARAPTPEQRPAGTPPRNVIIVVMDTARADAFGPFAKPDRIVKTPAFDALAARSTVFASAYNNENWTKPSVATTLSGLYPSTHNAKEDASKLSSRVELVSERLSREGFATAGFVANGYVSNMFGFKQGWGTWRNYIRENEASEAEHVFSDALAWHAEHAKRRPDQPFFLYLQTIDPHVTYHVDREFWAPYFDDDSYDGPLGRSIDADDQVALSKGKIEATERDREWLRALYWGEIAYHDAELAKFIAQLDQRRVLDDTLLVVTNDHGEELGERGRYGHGHQVFEEMIRAPLVIHYPPLFAPGTVIREIVEHVDLAPTVLDVLNRDPLKDADGISLVPLVRGQPTQQPHTAMIEFLHGRRVLRVGRWKLVARAGGGGSMFDVSTDPGETNELEAAVVARRLCEVHLGEALATPDKARRLHASATRRQFHAGKANISPQMRRQLEALGYLGGAPATSDERKDDDDN